MKIKNKIKQTPYLLAFLACMASLQPAIAAYKEPNSYKWPKRTITLGGSGKYSTSKWNDTGAFNSAINDVHAAGGGHVIVPGGTYVVKGVALKNNVHLVINKNARLRLPNSGGEIFTGGTLNNASVRGSGGSFIAELRGPVAGGTKVYHGWSIENVLLQNIKIINNSPTESQAIALSWRQKHKTAAGAKQYPNNVKLLNIEQTTRSHYGYGVMQAQAARNTDFLNLKGKGGVPVRLETGWIAMQLDGRSTGGVHGITVKNSASSEAQSTVKINPHSMNNGDVWVGNCSATGCVNSVSFEAGEAHKKALQDAGLGRGSFGKVTIRNTTAHYRDTGAPYKTGSFRNLPAKFVQDHATHGKFYKTKSGSKARSYDNFYMGPSANVIHNTGTAERGLEIKNIYRRVESKYGNVPNFRRQMNATSTIKAWMYRTIPEKNTPAGW